MKSFFVEVVSCGNPVKFWYNAYIGQRIEVEPFMMGLFITVNKYPDNTGEMKVMTILKRDTSCKNIKPV